MFKQAPILGHLDKTVLTRPFITRACLKEEVVGSRTVTTKHLLLLLGTKASGYPINTRTVTIETMTQELTVTIGCVNNYPIEVLQICRT